MRYARLGNADLVVSELGFGAFAIGGNRTGNSYGPTDDATSVAALKQALDLGCTFFDTADVYGHGHSETLIGDILGGPGSGQDVVIATKVGGNFDTGTTVIDFSRAHIERAVDASLRRLRRDRIDLYQLHNPDLATIVRGEVFDTLAQLQAAGKIRHFGVSIHRPEEGRAVMAEGRSVSLQLPYNMLALLESFETCDFILPEAVDAGIGVIVREPLNAGFLAGVRDDDSKFGIGDIRGGWPSSRRRALSTIADGLRFAEASGATRAQAALRFVLDEPGVTTTIVGMKTPAQVRENFGACDLPPFAEILNRGSAEAVAA
jgi:aryl-alcohol dehydrogenase-like predicted oxidoreductase